MDLNKHSNTKMDTKSRGFSGNIHREREKKQKKPGNVWNGYPKGKPSGTTVFCEN